MPQQAFTAMTHAWQQPDIRSYVVTVHEAAGVMVAVATAPQLLLPTAWMGQLLRHDDPDWLTTPEAGEVQHHALAYWNALDDCIDRGEPLPLPPDCRFKDGQVNDPLDAFAEGFLRAQEWLDPAWEDTGQRDREPLSLVLEFAQGALVYLCGNDPVRQEMRRSHPRLPADPGQLLPLLPKVFTELGLIGRKFRDDQASAEPDTEF